MTTGQAGRAIIKFPAYRRFDALRIIADDAMMALLIGGRVGRTMLAGTDPKAWLPDAVPVEDARRLNLRVAEAAELMTVSEVYLAYMGIPFVLAVYQSFLAHVVLLLRKDGLDGTEDDPFRLSFDTAHQRMADVGIAIDSDLDRLFAVVRQVRNRIIHYGGRQGSHLRTGYKQLPQPASSWWEKRTRRPLKLGGASDQLLLGPEELIGTLALTKEMARQLNERMAARVSRKTWATLMVEDYRTEQPIRFKAQAQRTRRLRGFARTYYQPLELEAQEIEDALRRVPDS